MKNSSNLDVTGAHTQSLGETIYEYVQYTVHCTVRGDLSTAKVGWWQPGQKMRYLPE